MAVREIILVSEPHVGLTIRIDGQEYSYVGQEDYTKLTGEVVNWSAWATQCRTCDEPFNALSDGRMTYMTRRCKTCRPKKPT